jgi:DNA repair protein RecN (Recombination protein N)
MVERVLEELRVRGLGVIEDALLELGPGFNVITGETGAGKTMVLSGIGLLFGSRADAALVRPGHERAEVEGRLLLAVEHAAVARAEQAGAELDDGVLLLARTVSSESRSRAYVGGRAVPAGVLAELADDLVAVHGQADQRGLLKPTVQRGVLDRFGGADVDVPLGRYREAFAAWSQVRDRLRDLTERRQERAEEADRLRRGLAEIAAVAPVRGEDGVIRAEIQRLAHADLLKRVAGAARTALSGEESAPEAGTDVLSLLGQARRALDEARGRDPELDALAGRVAELAYLGSDVAADLAAYADGIDADPARLALLQERLAALLALTRSHGARIDDVIEWAERAAVRLGDLDDDDDIVVELRGQHDRLLAELSTAGAALSAARERTARRLESAVIDELAALAMPRARLQVVVRDRADARGLLLPGEAARRVAFGPHGVDEVEIMLVAHDGAPPRPLHRGASGGELSRIMLALEVVLAGSDPVPTFVFDEVDAGVGGRAAVEVGRRLAALARTAQVLVVTHLPQVAAFADRHLVVDKRTDATGARTDVRVVEGADRLEELSRMLGGRADSTIGRGHAEELLAVAAAAKADAQAATRAATRAAARTAAGTVARR